MRNLKLTLEYDGSKFFGFQRQPDRSTIHEELEKALSKLFNRKMKIAAAAGRTDAGVHAAGQVVNFKMRSSRTLSQIQKGLNALLPHSVAVKKAEEVPEDFHARYSAKSKTYEYRIWNHPVRSPLQNARAYHVPEKLDLGGMRCAVKFLRGRHDFRSFCASGSHAMQDGRRRGTIRTIKRFDMRRKGALIRFLIEADGFLYHMVRNIVGTLLEVGRQKLEADEVRGILLARDRRRAGPTAPASALTLISVRY